MLSVCYQSARDRLSSRGISSGNCLRSCRATECARIIRGPGQEIPTRPFVGQGDRHEREIDGEDPSSVARRGRGSSLRSSEDIDLCSRGPRAAAPGFRERLQFHITTVGRGEGRGLQGVVIDIGPNRDSDEIGSISTELSCQRQPVSITRKMTVPQTDHVLTDVTVAVAVLPWLICDAADQKGCLHINHDLVR